MLPCEVSPCQNGGVCSNEKDGNFKCTCTNGYTGLVCTRKGNVCISVCMSFETWCTNAYQLLSGGGGGAAFMHGSLLSHEESFDNAYGIFYFRFNSKVLKGYKDWIEQLQKWLPSQLQQKKMKLCYRASENGWAASTFHSFCDNKGPTVVLVKSGSYVFGGYANEQWGGKIKIAQITN